MDILGIVCPKGAGYDIEAYERHWHLPVSDRRHYLGSWVIGDPYFQKQV